MKQNVLKITITLLLLLMLGALSIPFSKYFLIATYKQQAKNITVQSTLPKSIPKAESIEPPKFQDIIKQANNQNTDSIGQVVIPSASISQPIFVGLTAENMVQGVVDLFPNRDPNQQTLTLIGHHVSYESTLLFGGVEKLKNNADVYVRYLDHYYSYKVESNQIIKDTDLNQLQDKGPNYIFLITCETSSPSPYRVLVTAKKVSSAQSSQQIQANFVKEEKTVKNKLNKIYWLKFLIPLLIAIILTILFLIYLWRL